MTLEIAVSEDLRGRVRLGVLVLDGLSVAAEATPLQAEIDELCARLRAAHAGAASGAVPGVEAARTLYKRLGLDPTKTRPSNEALLRRVLKGEPLYRVNTLVDALNLCSLREQLPFGLYDLAHVAPPVWLRVGDSGAGYEGIRKGWINVESRPVLVDTQGPFGNPSADSARTCITLATTRALVIAYAPADLGASRLERVLADSEATLTRHCGGRATERAVLGAGGA